MCGGVAHESDAKGALFRFAKCVWQSGANVWAGDGDRWVLWLSSVLMGGAGGCNESRARAG